MKKSTKIAVIKPKSKGKNIRFSDEAHSRLYKYCKEKGYNLGAFCEMGALQRMEND